MIESHELIGKIDSNALIGKINYSVIVVPPKTQKKDVVPTKEEQIIKPDETYTGLSEVKVNPIPEEYIIPAGEVEFKQNGTYDVTNKANAKVSVPMPSGTLNINSNGTYLVRDKEYAEVNVPEKVLGTKTITSNGTYKATDDNLDGYSEVEVETSGVDINDYFQNPTSNTKSKYITYIKKLPAVDTSNLTTGSSMFQDFENLKEIPLINTSKMTNMTNMFSGCKSLTTVPQIDTSKATSIASLFYECNKITTIPSLNLENVINASYMLYNCRELKEIPFLNLSNCINMTYMFYGCQKITTIPQIDTQNITQFYQTFYNCSALTDIPQLKASKMVNIYGAFQLCKKLTNFGGMLNVGEAYLTTTSANYNNYKLVLNDSPLLTHDSLMNVINNLYDIKTKGCKTQGLVLGATNISKLTSEEIAIATERGFSVS